MLHCAPKIIPTAGSCYDIETLKKIVKSFNKKYPDHKISISTKNKKTLLKELRKQLSDMCSKDECFLEQGLLNPKEARQINSETFRPKMPKSWLHNKHTWLDNYDINAVMTQYEAVYPDFKWIAAIPADCNEVPFCELYKFNLKKLYSNGFRQIGMIFNLDMSYQPGSHWCAHFIDLKKHFDVSYYDSYGSEPTPQIMKFIDDVMEQISKIPELRDKNIKFEYNRRRHQRKNSECGMYSMNYIIQRLEGKSLKTATNKNITDDSMTKMRSYLYRPPS
jgi:hypothetical protein